MKFILRMEKKTLFKRESKRYSVRNGNSTCSYVGKPAGMAPSPGGLSRGRFPREWGGRPEIEPSEGEKVTAKTSGSKARRREAEKASQVSSIEEEEGSALLEGLQVIEGRPFISGASEPWFRRLYRVFDKKGQLLEQFPKLKLRGVGADFSCQGSSFEH